MNEQTVEWYVKINSAFYSVAYLGDPDGWRLTQLEGPRPGASYTLRLQEGRTTCTCPDGASQRRICKHVQALHALGSIAPREKRSAG